MMRAAGSILIVIGLVLGGVAWALGPSSAATGGVDDTSTTITAEGPTVSTSGDPTETTTQTGSTDGTDGGGDDSNDGTTSDTTTPGPAPTTDGAGATSTTLAGAPPTTIASAPANTDLSTKLATAARGAGFTVLGSSSSDWRLASVDSGTTSQGPYVATSYIRGTEYFSTSQEKGTSYPPMANTEAVTVRGQKGDLLDLGHVVVIRWIDGATSIIFSSNLKRDDALKMADSLAPVQ